MANAKGILPVGAVEPISSHSSLTEVDRGTTYPKVSTSDSNSHIQSGQSDSMAIDNEKTQDLARQATAKSQHGTSIRAIQTREDGTEYPTGAKLAAITVALCLAVFLMALE